MLFIACGTSSKMIETPVLETKTNEIKSVINTTSNFSEEENIIKTLSFLASDKLEGRDSGSAGIEKASVFLENIFKTNNVKPYFKTYRDTLSNFDKTST